MGSYAPAWNAQFGEPLVNQAIAIFQRDQAAALAIVNATRAAKGNAPLGPVNDIHKGPVLDTAYPCLFVRWMGEVFNREDPYTRHQSVRMGFFLQIADADPQMMMQNAADQSRSLDIVLTTAPSSDWQAALPIDHESVPSGETAPSPTCQVQDVFIDSRVPVWSDRGGENEAPTLAVHMEVLFELEET